MKAKDLMIGDWVLAYGKETQIVWVGNIHKMAVRGFPYEFMDGEIEPIPLTPEILEKIGFETHPNIGYIIDDYDGTQIIYDSWNNNLRIIKDYKICLDIKTFNDLAVHELQHALRICGIEKEIEL